MSTVGPSARDATRLSAIASASRASTFAHRVSFPLARGDTDCGKNTARSFRNRTRLATCQRAFAIVRIAGDDAEHASLSRRYGLRRLDSAMHAIAPP